MYNLKRILINKKTTNTFSLRYNDILHIENRHPLFVNVDLDWCGFTNTVKKMLSISDCPISREEDPHCRLKR